MDNNDSELEVTWHRTLVVWWAYIWRTAIFTALLGAILGFIGGSFAGLFGRVDLAGMVGTILGYLGSIPVSIVVLRIVLRKRYTSFAVKLVPLAR